MIELAAQNVRYRWRNGDESISAIEDVSAKFFGGEAHVLCGPSGSGKTTLGYLLAGLIEPQSGSISLNGISGITPHDAAYVLQFAENIFFEDTVGEELRHLSGSVTGEQYESFRCLGVDIQHIADLHPAKLSAGFGRLVAVGLQMARNPRILILDEPTIGLDWIYHARMTRALQKWIRPDRILITITHDLELISSLCGRVWILQNCRMFWSGTTSDFLSEEDLLCKSGL